MNEIKVSVSYEIPTTTKFDALMTEYEAAKKMADETVTYYKPLADVAEETKFDAIMEQLETIKSYAKRICGIRNNESGVWLVAYISGSERGHSSYSTAKFEVIYRPRNGFEIMFAGEHFTKERIRLYCEDIYNVIGKWEEWGVYKKLETAAYRELTSAIERQHNRAQAQINRLNNIIKED